MNNTGIDTLASVAVWIVSSKVTETLIQCGWRNQSSSSRVNLDFLVAHMVKNPPAMQETQFWSLGQEDPLEKGMATHSSFLAWRTPQTEEPGRL